MYRKDVFNVWEQNLEKYNEKASLKKKSLCDYSVLFKAENFSG